MAHFPSKEAEISIKMREREEELLDILVLLDFFFFTVSWKKEEKSSLQKKERKKIQTSSHVFNQFVFVAFTHFSHRVVALLACWTTTLANERCQSCISLASLLVYWVNERSKLELFWT